MTEKEICCKMKIENIDEFNKLLEQFNVIIDKIQNFKFKVSTSQDEQNH